MGVWHLLDEVEGMHKCLSAERPSCLNVEIEPRIK